MRDGSSQLGSIIVRSELIPGIIQEPRGRGMFATGSYYHAKAGEDRRFCV
jgi:hypothetical protein